MIEIRHDSMDSTTDIRAAYDQIYQSEGIQLFDSFYLWVIESLNPIYGSTLLDISCGQGRLVTLAQRKGIHAFGTDISLNALLNARNQGDDSTWFLSDGEQICLPDNSFDFITHIGSIEHYQNPAKGVREIARLLKPNGSTAVFLPNSFSLLGNIKYVMQNGVVFDDGQPLQRINTRGGWEQILIENGLVPFKVLGYERVAPRTSQDLLWYLRRPKKIARLLLSRIIPINLSNCFLFLCHRQK